LTLAGRQSNGHEVWTSPLFFSREDREAAPPAR
jgi:hypothetical protein